MSRHVDWSYGELPVMSTASIVGWHRRFDAVRWHTWIGVQPRARPGSSGADVLGYSCLVLDFDSEDEAREGSERLKPYELRASILVRSGRGLHVYFLLDSIAPKEDAEPVARRLVEVAGGDPVFDAPRVMRLPGSVNPRTNTVATVTRLEPDRRYDIDDIRRKLGDVAALSMTVDVAPEAASASVVQLVSNLSTRLQSVLEGDVSTFPSRSEADWSLACALVRLGATDEQLFEVFRSYPCSGKGEKRAGYVGLTVEKARRLAECQQTAPIRVRIRGVEARGRSHRMELVDEAGACWRTSISETSAQHLCRILDIESPYEAVSRTVGVSLRTDNSVSAWTHENLVDSEE